MADVRLIDVDITDRANGKLPVWDSAAGTHVYADPSTSGVPAGSSFPGSPATNDLFFHTTYGMIFKWDGTRWVTETLFSDGMTPVATIPISASATPYRGALPMAGVMGLWVEDLFLTFHVINGTALSASHKWTCPLQYAPAGTTIGTITIDSGALNAWRSALVAVDAAIATTQFEIELGATKTGTPGNLWLFPRYTYRLIGT